MIEMAPDPSLLDYRYPISTGSTGLTWSSTKVVWIIAFGVQIPRPPPTSITPPVI